MPIVSLNRRVLLKVLSFAGMSRVLSAQAQSATPSRPGLSADFEAAIERTREASKKFGNGDPEPMKAAYSHASDALIMGALGGYEQGGDKVAERLEWAAKHFHGTRNSSFERLAAGNDAEFGYEVFLERSESRVGDTNEYAASALRVTHIFRRESGEWKLIHRHADALKPRA